jgi:hypothetical protein
MSNRGSHSLSDLYQEGAFLPRNALNRPLPNLLGVACFAAEWENLGTVPEVSCPQQLADV